MNAIYSTLAVESTIGLLLLLWWYSLNKKLKMKNQLDERELLLNGFKRRVWYNRNGKHDPFINMKFVEFTKTINDDFRIEVTFFYMAEIEGEFDTLKETTCELNAGGGSYCLPLEQNIEALENIYKLLTNKK